MAWPVLPARMPHQAAFRPIHFAIQRLLCRRQRLAQHIGGVFMLFSNLLQMQQ